MLKRKALYRFGLLMVVVFLGPGCITVLDHHPVPEHLGDAAEVPGMPGVRLWGDEPPNFTVEWMALTKGDVKERYPAITGTQHTYLAMSGGGSNGAFGVGLMAGWTDSGTRPEFTLVTGISTSALAAPFVFLGSDYDAVLKEMFTTHTTSDILKKRNRLFAIFSDAIQATDPLKSLINEYVDEEVMVAIAAEYRKGRSLLIGTTNLDVSRPVIWKIGAIADSGEPGALDLIQSIMLASASIPAIFPPVHIPVVAGGKRYDELHVDGGTTSQVFVYPVGMDWSALMEKFDVRGTPQLYVIRNAKIDPEYGPAKPRMMSIVNRSIASLIRTQGIGDLYRIYVSAEREGVDFNYACIPPEFNEKNKEAFDPVYMTSLFDLGYSLAKSGYPWEKRPPGLIKMPSE